MIDQAQDVTFVLRVWFEPDDDRPRARLLDTEGDLERTAVGTGPIVELVRRALDDFVRRRDDGATPPRRPG